MASADSTGGNKKRTASLVDGAADDETAPKRMKMAENGNTDGAVAGDEAPPMDGEAILAAMPALDEATLGLLASRELNCFNYDDDQLSAMLLEILKRMGCLETLQTTEAALAIFVTAVRRNYHANPYHNFQHAFCVTQMTYALYTAATADYDPFLSDLEKAALAVAALCHDVDHPGHTNSFLINTKNPLAMIYNDFAPLEMHHCSVAFDLMVPNVPAVAPDGTPLTSYPTDKDNPAVFGGYDDGIQDEDKVLGRLGAADYRDLRKLVIELILATDMAQHRKTLDLVETKGGVVDMTYGGDRLLLMKMILKSADLSNAVRPWEISKAWSDRVYQEFFAQGDEERALGLPISIGMDRAISVPDDMVFFLKVLLRPQWAKSAQIMPSLSTYLDIVDSKIAKWTEIGEAEKAAAHPDDTGSAVAGRGGADGTGTGGNDDDDDAE